MVEFRAFRGTRRSSVYRSHRIDGETFRRIVVASSAEGLAALRQLVAVVLDSLLGRGIRLMRRVRHGDEEP